MSRSRPLSLDPSLTSRRAKGLAPLGVRGAEGAEHGQGGGRLSSGGGQPPQCGESRSELQASLRRLVSGTTVMKQRHGVF